jgi:hypothetical protein
VVSWYRGPLVPYAVPRRANVPVWSADASLRLDPGSGMLDASYAAAWQLGRLIALQNEEYCSALLTWKRGARRDTIQRMEQDILLHRWGTDGGVAMQAEATTFLKGDGLKLVQGEPVELPVPKLGAAPQPLSQRLRDPASIAESLTAKAGLPDRVSVLLERLARLEGVPFHYLVADESMLPPESVRFFRVDQNWIDYLVDGAFSPGRICSADYAFDDAWMRKVPPPTSGTQPGSTGVLLRSRVVPGWPGLEVTAEPAERGKAVTLVRRDRVAPDVLLLLYDGDVGRVQFHEPPEALHFGFDAGKSSDDLAAFTRALRDAAAKKQRVLLPLRFPEATGPEKGRTVVAVDKLVGDIHANVSIRPFSPAEFALQMVEGVGSVSFLPRMR